MYVVDEHRHVGQVRDETRPVGDIANPSIPERCRRHADGDDDAHHDHRRHEAEREQERDGELPAGPSSSDRGEGRGALLRVNRAAPRATAMKRLVTTPQKTRTPQ